MRVKTRKLVIAFETTTDVLAFEAVCTLGRIIPLPTEVKAGCGLAYCADVEHEKEIDQLLKSFTHTKKILWMY